MRTEERRRVRGFTKVVRFPTVVPMLWSYGLEKVYVSHLINWMHPILRFAEAI